MKDQGYGEHPQECFAVEEVVTIQHDEMLKITDAAMRVSR